MFGSRGRLPYFVRIKSEENLPAVYFVNTTLTEKRVRVSEKQLSELPDDSPNIFKKSNIEHYMERPSALFCNEKHTVINNSSHA